VRALSTGFGEAVERAASANMGRHKRAKKRWGFIMSNVEFNLTKKYFQKILNAKRRCNQMKKSK
jgi:hypothetical protein